VTICWVKKYRILCKLAKILFFTSSMNPNLVWLPISGSAWKRMRIHNIVQKLLSPYRIGINTKTTTGASTIGGTGRIGVQNDLTSQYKLYKYRASRRKPMVSVVEIGSACMK
jgi:hypothetical protein